MGSASSRAAHGSASSARKFPTRSPGSTVTSQATQLRTPRAQLKGNGTKDQAIKDDAKDPDFSPSGFADRLQQMGIVSPNPTFSPSSRAGPNLGGAPSSAAGPVFPSADSNTTVSTLTSRAYIQRRADEDMEHFQQVGIRAARRRHVDVRTLVDALQMLGKGVPAAEVESRFGIEAGALAKLGRPGILTHLTH